MEPESPRNQNKNKRPRNPNKLPSKLPRNQICVNMTDCSYALIEHVFENILNWKTIKDDPEDYNCDIIWSDSSCNQDMLGKLKSYQKLNHYPGIVGIARKNFLAYHLNKMKKQFPEFYDFYPETYCLPSDRNHLVEEFKDVKRKTFIVKPEASAQGRGIYLARRLDDLPLTENFVVQRYVDPLTIDGFKFDMRIYVLITSVSPLTIYMYKEGLSRFATEQYEKPCDKNLDDAYKHLTNYSINKFSNKFEFSKDPDNATSGHKRSLESIRKFLDDNFQNSKEVFDDIKKLVIKTICTIQPIMKHIYSSCQSDDFTGNMCFQILGFDVILSSECKPLLLEVNHAPSFNSDTPFDFRTKTELLASAFKIMDINVERRNFLIAADKKKLAERLVTGKRNKLSTEEKEQLRNNYRLELNNNIEERLGLFEQIMPDVTFDEPYEEFMAYATKIHREKTGVSNQKARPVSKVKPNITDKKIFSVAKKKKIKVKSPRKLERILDSVNRLYRKSNTLNLETNENRMNNAINKKTRENSCKPNQAIVKTNIVTLQFPTEFNFK